ncbi:MAG: hypothetical protein PHS93_09430 [Candidatus Omnitrophica bacterium]|nr:hypothetical protein [Candidatus Omnitrophota bacterium]MDD5353368.1 hypothetical protein [Candidatus Omnitrophota bacterium]MDD5592072.1 hypothetical protein [Candidatus Omnitrophota bacterium]
MNRYSLIFCLVCFLSGCVTLGQPIKSEYKQSINNIAVVSIMGDNFNGVKIGTTVFNNDQFEEDFSTFGMDRKIEESIATYLKHHSGLNAVIRPDLRKGLRGNFGYKSNPKQSLERLRSHIQNLKAEGIDALIIISPSENIFGNTYTHVNGYGFVVQTFLMMWYAKAYFISNFTLVDTATQKIVFDRAWWWWKDIKFSRWQKSFLELTLVDQETLKNFFGNVVDSEIPKFLKKFNF